MKERRFIDLSGLALVALLLLAPRTAFGQGTTWPGIGLAHMVDAAKWRWGLLRVNAALELRNAGYDSDIYYGYFDKPTPDFTLAVGLPVQVFLPASKKVVLELFDNPQYLFYLDSSQERAWNNVFQGQVHIALERVYIGMGTGLSNVRRRLSPELNINIRQKEESLNGTLLWRASRATSLAFVYGGSRFDYGDAQYNGVQISELLNRREGYFNIITYLQLNPKVRYYLDGQYGTYSFLEEGTISRDARSLGIFGGFELIPGEGQEARTPRFQGRASLGYMHLDFKAPQFADGSGLAGSAELSVELFRRTMARVFFSRGFQFSIYSQAQYYTLTAYGGRITRLLSRRASFSYDLSFGRSTYPLDETGIGLPQGLRYTTHSAFLNLMLARNLAIAFEGTFGRRTQAGTDIIRKRDSFGFSLIYGARAATLPVPAGGISR